MLTFLWISRVYFEVLSNGFTSAHVLFSSEFYFIDPEENDMNGLELATIVGGVQRETRENTTLGRSRS